MQGVRKERNIITITHIHNIIMPVESIVLHSTVFIHQNAIASLEGRYYDIMIFEVHIIFILLTKHKTHKLCYEAACLILRIIVNVQFYININDHKINSMECTITW